MISSIVIFIVGTVASVALLLAVRNTAREVAAKSPKRPKCRVDEETGGLFIGQRYCSTHNKRWDDGGPCPAVRIPQPPYELQPWTIVPFRHLDGEVVEMAIVQVEQGYSAVTITMQDAKSLQRQHTWPGA